MIKLALIAALCFSLFISTASASNWGDGPFEKKLPKQSVNKSMIDKFAMWLKHVGSSNAPVCGVTLCKAKTIVVTAPDGIYTMKAKIKP